MDLFAPDFSNIITADEKMQDVLRLISKVVDNDIPILIQGESGTGKELIARVIHANSRRKDEPFIIINCASIQEELLEGELFGYEKGFNNGAYQRRLGKLEQAHEGIIFLDEIGEVGTSLQVKLLRLIQEKEFERIGGAERIKFKARIISATNCDLKRAVEQKQFRKDLYYCLNSFPINIPPLRQRRNDILPLANHFLNQFNKRFGKRINGFSKKALKALYDYAWPDNVRELENIMEQCTILVDNNFIDILDLPEHIRQSDGTESVDLSKPLFDKYSRIIPFEKLKEEAIRHALATCNGNIVEAARKLQVGRATIYRLIEKYNIDTKYIIQE